VTVHEHPLPPWTAVAASSDVVEDVAGARHWLGIAVWSLVASGILSLALVIGRLPPLDALFTDPLFFQRCLVVHVDLALVVWFLAFILLLWSLLPTARPVPPSARASSAIGAAGVAVMVASTAVPDVEPILANYIPVLDHPLFFFGLVTFAVAVLARLLGPRLLAGTEAATFGGAIIPPAARPGVRAAGVAVLLAAITFLTSWWTLPPGLHPGLRYELLMWGGGHVLQFASVAAMMAAWLMLLTPVLGRSPLPRRASAVLFGLLIAPALVAPLMANPMDPGSRAFFTSLMQYGIFPVVTVVLVVCLVAIARAGGRWGDGRVIGFLTSAGLTVLGFGLGAAIDGSNTMVPAHYHASIGAVTAAFMAVTHLLLPRLGLRPYGPRAQAWARWQPLVFGGGQMVFALGFAIAGAAGMARKTYGAEQVAVTDATQKTVGLVVMGVGGLVAVIGGVTFLVLVIRAWRRPSTPASPRPT